MSDERVNQPEHSARTDPMGYHLPPNERFMPGDAGQEDWEPEFYALGTQPPPVEQDPPAPVSEVIPPTPGQSGPSGAAWSSGPQPGGFTPPVHRHPRRWKGQNSEWSWLWIVFIVLAVMSGMWWLIFLAWPISKMIKTGNRPANINKRGVGLLLIGLGVLSLTVVLGLSPMLFLPLLLILAGGYMLINMSQRLHSI